MTLTRYKRKRDFTATSEPKGNVRASRGALRFVVQKHAASHVHYDFRLELDGVLKSWALPKGPSMNPSDKRLAMMVEDHPLDYRTFEGSIPEGNYGAGEVIVWDEGVYHAEGTSDRLESTRMLRHGLEEGKLSFTLEGKKLKGGFTLIKTGSREKPSWLLIKRRDRFAELRDIREDITSGGTGEIAVNGHTVKFTHPDKVYWPEEEVTKGDLLDYYSKCSRYIMPYLLDRPQSLHRFPDGIQKAGFFQKDVGTKIPERLKTAQVPLETETRKIRYLVCTDQASLAYMVNLGGIEMHPWFSRVGKLDNPDYLVLDLDPEGVKFDGVVETALVIKKLLDRAGAPCFCKTSGATGLHIFVPLKAEYDYDVAKNFAHLIARMVNAELPRLTSLERSPEKRKKKVYIDFLQNTKGQTVVAPYSVRPRPGAPVSTPLEWDELRAGLDPREFTIQTILQRLKKKGDLFKKVLGPGIDIEAGLEKLGEG
jgi:bifunctional non-homologous end joining protein LigD